MESSVRESSAAASSLRKLIRVPGIMEWRYGSCRRCLPWSPWPTTRIVNPRDMPWSTVETRPKLPRLRLRYGLPPRRLYIRL